MIDKKIKETKEQKELRKAEKIKDTEFTQALKSISDQLTKLSNDPEMVGKEMVYQNQVNSLLQRRNILIEVYMKNKGWEVQGELQITRHPESKGKEKLYGLSPDATPSDNGVASLKPKDEKDVTHASNFMHLLLRNPKKPVIFARSNMIRAGMLCNMIMKSVIKNDVRIIACENSSDFQETQGRVSAASTTPIPDDPAELAKWRSHNEKLSSARKELSQQVNTESQQIIENAQGVYQSENSKGISKKDANSKNETIDALLLRQKPVKQESKDQRLAAPTTWLVGHGKTSKNYLKSIFGKSYSFDFSTTKTVYLVKDNNGKPFYFSPPGAVKVNNSGKLEGVFLKNETLLLRSQELPKKKIKAKNNHGVLNKLAGSIAKKFSSTAKVLKLSEAQINQTKNFSATIQADLNHQAEIATKTTSGIKHLTSNDEKLNVEASIESIEKTLFDKEITPTTPSANKEELFNEKLKVKGNSP